MKKYIKPATGIVAMQMISMFASITSGYNDTDASGYDPDTGSGGMNTKEDKGWNDGSFWGE